MRMKIPKLVLLLFLSSVPVLLTQSAGQPGRVRVVGLIKVNAGREADFEALITTMVSRTKRDDRGNIRYEFFRASPPLAQSLRSDRRAADYVFVEEWVDQRSVDAHLKWAKPIVETEWKSLTESTEFLGFNPDTVG